MARSHPGSSAPKGGGPERREAERPAGRAPAAERWSAPRFEVIPLACEITAYAPDDTPLF